MKPEIAQEIVNLNHQFYQSFAADFSETRGRLQPGVIKVLERIPPGAMLLDLGCGNGKIPLQLAENGFQGTYLGVDFSLGLLDWAARDQPKEFKVEFRELDLTSSSWEGILPPTAFDVVCCFATLHHIPGQRMRRDLCRNMRKYLKVGGLVYLSAWQFTRSERLKSRILPWDTIGLQEGQVDEGDFLLDWRRGGKGIRYVHLYSAEELALLADASGFKVVETFDCDGEGGNLGHYQVWEAL